MIRSRRYKKIVLQKVSLKKEFKKLLTVCGIRDILGISIMLETEDI